MLERLTRISRRIAVAAGADIRLRTPDRDVLENIIFPYFARDPLFRRILFIGCDWYTKGYEGIFADREYWTMEPKHSRRWFGASRHIEDFCQHAPRHFQRGGLDVIFMNGVFGWGLNARQDIEDAIAGYHDCLREGGVFVFGWNDVPKRRPLLLQDIESLKRFRALAFPPLGSARYVTLTENRHTFNFFIK